MSDRDDPFLILVAGDFGGEERKPLESRTPIRVDRDDLDEVLRRFAPSIELEDPSGARLKLRFREIDEFHPDRVASHIERLEELREEGRRDASSRPAAPRGTALLDAILDRRDEPAPPPVETPEAAMSALLRGVLHARAFRELEAAWRGVDFLTRRLPTDELLRIHVLDVSREELDTHRTALHRLLVEGTVGTLGGQPYALAVLLSSFDAVERDAETLGAIARIAGEAGTALVAGAGESLAGCASLADTPDPDDWTSSPEVGAADAWKELRQRPEALRVALGLPRLILRPPYGRETDPIETFAFEELSSPPRHDELLWGNPALALALVLGEGFAEHGWELRAGEGRDIDGLPVVVSRDVNGTRIVPCSETPLTMRAAQRLMDGGLTPLLWMKDTDRVRVPGVISLAPSRSALRGRWSA